ncbi:MAG: metalloregulator ArsR/SmtB family transcription factor [Gemmataceae bacterium]
MIDYQAARKVAARLAALAEPTRVRVIDHLAHGPLHVGALAELLDVPMVNLSHHLGVMRQAGLLDDEKEGRRVVYRLHPDVARPGDGDAIAVLDLDGFKVRVRNGAALPGVTAKPKKK